MTTSTITWLHLSDAHLRSSTGWDHHRVLDPLIDDLKAMEDKHELTPDLIFFTGDLAFGETSDERIAEQFTTGFDFLESIRKAFKHPVPLENLFIVPGNHDVNRNEVTAQEIGWLDNTATTNDVVQMIQSANKSWKNYMDRLGDFRKFLEGHGFDHLLDDPDRLIFAHRRQVAGYQVGLAGLNSAWSCCRNNEQGRLWMAGDWQLGQLHREVKDCDLTIALMHHPTNWLCESENGTSLWRKLERNFDFCLHGHEHQGWVQEINDRHVRISAAACYERSDKANGYNFVRLDLNTGDREVWLRQYTEDSGGWIPRIISGSTDNNGRWSLKSPAAVPANSLPATKAKGNERVESVVPTVDASAAAGNEPEAESAREEDPRKSKVYSDPKTLIRWPGYGVGLRRGRFRILPS